MSTYLGDNRFRALDGTERSVDVRARVVDATYLETIVPAMRSRPFAVADGIDAVPPNELARLAPGRRHFTIVGAGKTGMDACLWLIRHGISPDRLRWIMPRDSWLMNRANIQPGPVFAKQLQASLTDRMTAVLAATSLQDLFSRLEAAQALLRIDPRVQPTMYHCAIVSLPELQQLRRITDVVRLGHVENVEHDQLVLEHGTVPADPSSLYVDCTTSGLPRPPSVPVFDADRITLQSVRGCQQVFSSALIAHVEATHASDEARNALCEPIPHPDAPIDWLRIMMSDNRAQLRWLQDAELTQWLESARLNILRGSFAALPRDLRVREKAVGMVRAALEASNAKLAELMRESQPVLSETGVTATPHT